MDLDLAGRTAVVTGASRGIGLEIVRALVAEGVTVVAGARTPTDELRALTDHAVAVDLAVAGGPEELIAAALADVGGIDLLVNNVGGNPAPFDGFLSVTDEHWDHVFELNLMSTVRATRAALPSLVERRGAIVNVASTNAHLAQPVVVAYAAAKAALLNLGKALADEFGPQGVRVNTISPGPTLTPLWTDPGSAGAAMATAMGMTQTQLIEHARRRADHRRRAAEGRLSGRARAQDDAVELEQDRVGLVREAAAVEHRERGRVVLRREGDDRSQPLQRRRVLERQPRQLGRVAAPLQLGRDDEAGLDLGAAGDDRVAEPDLADEGAAVALAHRPRAEAVALPVGVEVADERLALLARADAAEMRGPQRLRDARVGEQRRVVVEVGGEVDRRRDEAVGRERLRERGGGHRLSVRRTGARSAPCRRVPQAPALIRAGDPAP